MLRGYIDVNVYLFDLKFSYQLPIYESIHYFAAMAFYDNKHWLLSHIRNSFVSSDDTGMCEMVMQGENLSHKLVCETKFDYYPGDEESEEDDMDAMGQSFDIQSDLDFGAHRARSNTVQRLKKMERDKKRASETKVIKWENNPSTLTDDERAALFQTKELTPLVPSKGKHRSLLSTQLEQCPSLPRNPFQEYAKFDGNAQVGAAVRCYGVFLTMMPDSLKNYPLEVVVLASAKVQDLIGLTCYKCTTQHPNHQLVGNVDQYALYFAEDDGEVDWDFPNLDPGETVGKFGFKYLALVELKVKQSSSSTQSQSEEKSILDFGTNQDSGNKGKALNCKMQEAEMRMKGHMSAMEAPLYQCYRVFIVNKMRAKTEINLGISGEKIEIDPVISQKVSARFWGRQRAVSYDTESIVACENLGVKSDNRGMFRIVYYSPSSQSLDASFLHLSHFKHHDFEAAVSVADDIVQKLTHILELRTSVRRREYLAMQGRKNRRKTFNVGPTKSR